MQPIDYTIDVESPFKAALQGYSAGAAIRDDQVKQQTQQLALQQQLQMQRDLGAFALKPNPTGQDYAAIMARYPQLSEHFKKSFDVLNTAQQQSKLNQSSQVYAALHTGKPEIASQLLRDQAAAMRNSGGEEDAKAAETMAQWIEKDPQSAKTTAGLMLSAVMGPDKFASTFSTLGTEGRAAAEAPAKLRTAQAEATVKEAEANVAPQRNTAEVNNINSQILERAKRLSLDEDKLLSDYQVKVLEFRQKATTLDDGGRKIVNEAAAASVAADQSSGQLLSLADQIEKAAPRSGITARGAELYKSITGNQDAITALRQEYTRMRNSQGLKMLPPGPATDKDVELALKGVPDENADPAMMASFLRGMAKLQKHEAAAESAKAEWVNAVGHLGKPKADIEVDGIKIPAGTTFTDFARKYLGRKTEQIATEQKAQQVQGRSYMRFAQPQTSTALGSGFYQPGGQ